MDDDVVTSKDFEEILAFHRNHDGGGGEVERLAGTINFALDQILSKLVEKMKEEEHG